MGIRLCNKQKSKQPSDQRVGPWWITFDIPVQQWKMNPTIDRSNRLYYTINSFKEE